MPILFDVDDTLLDDRRAQDLYLAHLFDAYRNVLPYPSQPAFRSAWRTAIDRHFARYVSGEISFEEQRRARIREVFGEPGMTESRTEAIVAEFLTAYEASWRLFPEVVDTLNDLRGTKLGIITNGSHEQQIKKLRSTGILDCFSVVVVSEPVGCAKPAREIFEHARAQFGCRAQDCAFVGDDWSRDVVGSAAVEMMPIWISRGDRAMERDGVLAISSLAELTKRPDVCAAIARHRSA